MNRLELLLKKWKAGSVKDPDLFLCLKFINDIYIGRTHEGTTENIQGTDSVPGESNSPTPSRPKAKRLRERSQGGSD